MDKEVTKKPFSLASPSEQTVRSIFIFLFSLVLPRLALAMYETHTHTGD